jgi:hypothetical protein
MMQTSSYPERMKRRSDMDTLPDFAEAIRKVTAAYAEGFSIMAKSVGSLPKGSTDARQLTEHWLRQARMIKDGTVTAIDQGFELWEREIRRLLDSGASTATAPPASANPMEVWAENWKKGLETMLGAGATWNEEARKQMESLQKTMQEGLSAWQRLFERKS